MNVVVWALFAHFVADFMLQSRWMGENKSKNIEAMLLHIATYTVTLSWMMIPMASTPVLAAFYGMANGLAHLATDSLTSKASGWCYENKKMHEFWCVIGFDQFLHAMVLVLTLPMLVA